MSDDYDWVRRLFRNPWGTAPSHLPPDEVITMNAKTKTTLLDMLGRVRSDIDTTLGLIIEELKEVRDAESAAPEAGEEGQREGPDGRKA